MEKAWDEVQAGRGRVGWHFGCNLGLRTVYWNMIGLEGYLGQGGLGQTELELLFCKWES